MTIIGVTTVRDEEDVIGTVLRHHLAEGVDHLIVALLTQGHALLVYLS